MKTISRAFATMVAALAMTAATTTTAHADEPVGSGGGGAAPGSAEMREAETRFKEGTQLYSQGNINEARVKLVQAYAVLGRTNILWNLAVAEFYSSRFLESVRHMRMFVKASDADANDVALATKQFLPQLEKQTGRIAVDAPRSSTIAVDGDEMGPAPLDAPVDVLPGRHLVLARTGAGNATLTVTVRAGQVVPAKLVEDNGGAGTGAPSSGTTTASSSAQQPSSDNTSSDARPSSAKTVTVIALGAGALVAGGFGLGFFMSSQSSDSDAKAIGDRLGSDPSACSGNANPDCARLREANDARDRDGGLATGMFVGAGVLAVSAGLAYLLWPTSSLTTTTRVRASVLPTPSGAAGTLNVTF